MEATYIPKILGDFLYDGILGLLPTKTYLGDNSYIPQSFHLNTLSIRPRFSLYLSQDDEGESSRLVIGSKNYDYYDITTYNEYKIYSSDKWDLKLTGICGFNICKFDPAFKTIVFSLSTPNLSIRESLKSLLNIPGEYWTSYTDCSTIKDQLQNKIYMVISGGKSFSFSIEDYLLVIDSKCKVNIDVHDDTADYDVVFGINFMKKYYTVFDIEKKVIGVA